MKTVIHYREKLIAELEKRMAGAARVLKTTYRHDLVLIFLHCEKEIQIQKAYLSTEGV